MQDNLLELKWPKGHLAHPNRTQAFSPNKIFIVEDGAKRGFEPLGGCVKKDLKYRSMAKQLMEVIRKQHLEFSLFLPAK